VIGRRRAVERCLAREAIGVAPLERCLACEAAGVATPESSLCLRPPFRFFENLRLKPPRFSSSFTTFSEEL
jgi:hypothetical protein